MRIAGIICEYNPFHRGHRFQIQETRRILGEDTGILCLMSGNYVQRGEPAIFDKWRRARSAVLGGANLVLELPLTIAVNAAGYFSSGAVSCMDALGAIDVLCFGSESGDLRALRETAALLGTAAFDEALNRQLKTGVSYARARELALTGLGGCGDLLITPNNTLGVDYLRRLMEIDSAIAPMTLRRSIAAPKASQLRQILISDPAAHTLENGERAMLAVLRRLKREDFTEMPFGSEGLWSKVMKACGKQETVEEILQSCKSKRYAYSRLRRILLCLFLGLRRQDLERPIPYLRVLAFDDRGRQMLRTIRVTSTLQVISGAGELPREAGAQEYFGLESRAADLYGLFARPGHMEPPGWEKIMPPVYVRESAKKLTSPLDGETGKE